MFNKAKWDRATKAVVVGEFGDATWGELEKRPIQHFYFAQRTPCKYSVCNDKLTVTLLHAMHFSPYASELDKLALNEHIGFVNKFLKDKL